MFSKYRSLLMMPLLAGAISVATGGTASAQTCNKVEIRIRNSTPDEIKVKKFEYLDFEDKWRTETGMFGVDGFQKLMPDSSVAWTRALGGAGGHKTKFRVTYVDHIGGSKWTDNRTFTTPEFTCIDGMYKLVEIVE